ncbi:hypothetical protein [Paracidovorax konjaci]|uniref:Cytochrome oxidase Cu insertion factor, SCO1/SenC/PrrC family n=1 Tax=Paracidovorax konjaci TaxID=32040 RepID=A0A1I1SI74_9BURK|nr:hypothetical protein [Paracidovorax konjaci]SFD46187.1 hypothetical protein SAMN04489710_102238 [Paracidovorax konjaci]
MSGSKSSDASFAQAASRPPEAGESDAAHPLGLSVHGLPATGEAIAALETRSRQGRWKMLGVLLVCAAPVIASYTAYYVVRPEARRSYGELIEPQRPLPAALAAPALDGRPGTLGQLQGQWLLVSVAPGACDEVCRNHLYLQRQLREGLGKDKDRMDWVWLVTDGAEPPAEIAPGLRGATVRRVDAQALAGWLAPAQGHALSDHLFVVDPMGHWMMRFPARLDAAGAARAKRDLERLMRASASWDQPGRPGVQP